MKSKAGDHSSSHLSRMCNNSKLRVSFTRMFSFLRKEAYLFTSALKQLPQLRKRNIIV